MAVKMPSSTLKKECAAILESMKVGFIHFFFLFNFIITHSLYDSKASFANSGYVKCVIRK